MPKPFLDHTPTIAIDYDKYGHCVLCHRNLIVDRLINGKVEQMFHKDYRTERFMLDDGSQMTVSICKKCKKDLTPDMEPQIMASVIKGWQMETDKLVETGRWKKEYGKKHMDRYKKKKVFFKSGDLPKNVIERKFKEMKEKKEKKEKNVK